MWDILPASEITDSPLEKCNLLFLHSFGYDQNTSLGYCLHFVPGNKQHSPPPNSLLMFSV